MKQRAPEASKALRPTGETVGVVDGNCNRRTHPPATFPAAETEPARNARAQAADLPLPYIMFGQREEVLS